MQASTAWHSLDSDALVVAEVTRSRSSDVCQLIESSVSLLADGLTSADPQPKSDHNIVVAGLLASNLGSLRCCHVLAEQGYYAQAITQLRNVYENWVAVQYLVANPTNAHLWLSSSCESPPHKQMIGEIRWEAADLMNRAKTFYHVLCKFAHTSFAHVLPNVGGKGSTICFGSHYDDNLFRGCAYLASMLIAFTMDEVAQRVNPQLPWHADRERLMARIETFIDEENRRHGQPAAGPNAQ